MKKNYQTKTPAVMTVPDSVAIAMTDLAEELREGLLALADGLEAKAVSACGELGEHLLHGEAAQHLGRGEVLIGGHGKFTGSIC